jgi:AbrB family looped-hinge helix DNA binding protein
MSTVATTRMSSKGQVVIPESVRVRIGLRPGDEFVVVGEGDVVILKTLTAPDPARFARMVAKARKDAKAAGLTRAAVTQAIRRVGRKS